MSYLFVNKTSKVCMNFDSSAGCEREMFGHLQHNNRVGDALIMMNDEKIYAKYDYPVPYHSNLKPN